MPTNPKFLDEVPVGRIFLRLDNPRHKPVETELMAIARLCAKELIYPLARDIAKYGLNPLERFALVPVEPGKTGPSASFISGEGNRRICALKLLNDPELAPANLRKAFKKLAENSIAPTKVTAAVFNDYESLDLWLERIHTGLQGGIGRKNWDAEQKQQFDGGSKNKAAKALLDYAEAEKMLSAEERAGKLTTVQRFVGNSVFREVVGFDQENTDDVGRTRPKAEFDILVRRFIRDLVKGKDVHSRMNKDHIIRYARPLSALAGVSTTRIETESLTSGQSGTKKKTRRKKPSKPEKAMPEHHAEVARRVIELERNWVVTYDDTPEIRRLYRDRRQYCFDISYTLHEKRVGTELLIASKGIKIPDEARDRQVNRPQYRAA